VSHASLLRNWSPWSSLVLAVPIAGRMHNLLDYEYRVVLLVLRLPNLALESLLE